MAWRGPSSGAFWELTVPSHIAASRVDKLDLVLIQARQRSQILVLAFVREGVDTFIAVMEVRKQDVGAFSRKFMIFVP